MLRLEEEIDRIENIINIKYDIIDKIKLTFDYDSKEGWGKALRYVVENIIGGK